MAKIANQIRQYRVKMRLTQEELAERVGVTRQTIIAIEKGGYVPSLELAFKIALVFGKPLAKVFTYLE